MTVKEIAEFITGRWKGSYKIDSDPDAWHEARYLQLDCSKAFQRLKWKAVLDIKSALDMTVSWYKKYYDDKADAYQLCLSQIEEYSKKAAELNLVWAK